MTRRRRIFLGLGAAAFTVVGLWMFVVGDQVTRLWGLIAILFFGVGGGAALTSHFFTRPAREAVLLRVVDHQGSRRSALVFPVSRARASLGLVACAALAAAGVIMAAYADVLGEEGDPSAIELLLLGVIMVAFFGVGLAVARNVISADAYLALLADGVLWRA